MSVTFSTTEPRNPNDKDRWFDARDQLWEYRADDMMGIWVVIAAPWLTPKNSVLTEYSRASETGRSSTPVVKPGQVRLSGEPYLIHLSEGCQVWDIDCDTKYAQGCLSIGDDDVEVLLYKGERTLRADDSTDLPTRITFPKVGSLVMFDGGRYSWQLAMFTHNTSDDPTSRPKETS